MKNDIVTPDGYPIPGTVRILDLNEPSQRESDHVVLVPQPSKDPNDPLNWPRYKKNIVFGLTCFYVFMAAGQSAGLSPALLSMEKDMGISLADLNAGSGYLFLFYGIGCVVLQPLALSFGRRSIFLLSLLLGGVVCQIWLVHSANGSRPGNFYANRILTGFLLSPVESLGEIVCTDLYFAHERGYYFAFYGLALLGASFLFPLAGGFINGSMGWQWIPYFCAIFSGVGVILLFLFFEETMYHRDTAEIDVNDQEKRVDRQHRQIDESIPVKTFAQRLQLFDSAHADKSRFLPNLVEPFILLYRYPMVSIAAIMPSAGLVWFMIFLGTMASILAAEPYNFSDYELGLFYIGPTIGVVVNSIAGGWLSDLICLKLASRNEGLREPEYRIYANLLCTFITPLGIWLYGLGAYYGLPWIAVCFGATFIAYSINGGNILGYIYVLDTYKEMGGSAITLVILIRNLFGFAFGYAITPWIEAQGLKRTFLCIGFLGFAFWLVPIFMILFGKKLRARSAKHYHEYLQTRTSTTAH
ncbi:protein Hol1p [Trichomonascus vanleenenianus]|uniref:protein Hol1p n=1 Tax=Trichomonascus vanleenenianus TaxID=2268995 RepID=UPI003ECA2779